MSPLWVLLLVLVGFALVYSKVLLLLLGLIMGGWALLHWVSGPGGS